MWRANIVTGLGFSEKAVWSRAARRQAIQAAVSPDSADKRDPEVSLGFKIFVDKHGEGSQILIWWVKGHDSVLFESFCGMTKRKVEEGIK